MNKFGMVLGVAAVATLAGCKDPDYVHGNAPASQGEVKVADAQPIVVESAPAPTPIVEAPAEKPIVVKADVSAPVEPVVAVKPTPVAAPAPVAETTTYIVQKGDVLSKIAKKYNLKVSDILAANPKIKKDVIWVGMKLKLPGKIDVGQQTAAPAATKGSKTNAPYSGATVTYVVKSGDTLGAIAYGKGINVRQLKELNGLKSDVIRVGQKLKVPAEKVVSAASAKASAPAKTVKKANAAPVAAAKPVAKPAEASAAVAPEKAPAAEPAAKPEVAAAPAPATTPAPAAAPAPSDSGSTYVVQEGDDMTGVSIRWGVSAAAIRELNNLPDDAQLVPGQILKLPADAQP